jgi:hypothetical protein
MIGRAPQKGLSGAQSHVLMAHVVAGSLALFYAWLIFNTRLVTTGVQFVSPLAVILAAHLAWLWASSALRPGYARVTFMRALTTTAGIVFCVALAALYAPTPAEAESTLVEQLLGPLAVLACLAVLAFVVFIAAGTVYLIVRGLIALFEVVRDWLRGPPGSGGERHHDLGLIGLAFLVIGTSSLEGVVPAFTFSGEDAASSSVDVAAPPARVWQQISTATSPSFPLPAFLKAIPQPVAVVVDEGAALGARRIVRFRGREGEGDLVLKVVRRTDREVVFQAFSDSSPIAGWVRQRQLTFRVEPVGERTRLTVSLDYERLLSPAWFFSPYIGLASYLAVDVLARDTKQRAEAR